jgi:hypothetical protein
MKPLILSFILAIYSVAAITREFLPGHAGWLFGLLAFHAGAAFALGFLTNSRVFAVETAMAAMAVETVIFNAGSSGIAIWAGTLVELAPCAYFAHRFYLTMGD